MYSFYADTARLESQEDCLEMTGYVIDPTGDYAKEGAGKNQNTSNSLLQPCMIYALINCL
jgi:hypothetical protein